MPMCGGDLSLKNSFKIVCMPPFKLTYGKNTRIVNVKTEQLDERP